MMNREFPLAPTDFGDEVTRLKRKLARRENREINKDERKMKKTERKISRSTGLEYEPKVRKRDMRPLVEKNKPK